MIGRRADRRRDAREGRECRAMYMPSGDEPRAAPVLVSHWEGFTVNIAVLAAKDERTVLKSSLNGRAVERANEQAVAGLLEGRAA